MIKRIGILQWLAFTLVTVSGPNPAMAADFPVKPIKIIVAFPPGGVTDTGARTFAAQLEKRVKQPVIVENKPGAGGTIGAAFVVRSAPDGYTLLYSTGVSLTSTFNKNGAIDVLKDLHPVSGLVLAPWVLYVNSSLPIKTFKDLLTYAGSNPGKLNAGLQSPSALLGMAVLKNKTGLDYVPIPYKGSGQVIPGILAGEVHMTFDVVSPYLSLAETGRVRPLLITAIDRSPVLPDVPTSAEIGVAGFETAAYLGIWAPARTPKEVIDRLAAESKVIMSIPEVKEQAKRVMGATPVGSTPEEFRRFVEAEVKFWTEAARLANYQPQ